jgi:very-short-patch-repair endonuclease
MKDKGYFVLRFTEKETLENCEGVIESILAVCGNRTPAP